MIVYLRDDNGVEFTFAIEKLKSLRNPSLKIPLVRFLNLCYTQYKAFVLYILGV